jgi:hypothetical protein
MPVLLSRPAVTEGLAVPKTVQGQFTEPEKETMMVMEAEEADVV